MQEMHGGSSMNLQKAKPSNKYDHTKRFKGVSPGTQDAVNISYMFVYVCECVCVCVCVCV